MKDQSTPGAIGSNDLLGPLPEPAQTSYVTDSVMRSYEVRSYTDSQMRDYAAKAVAAWASSALTDEQVDKGIEAWFTTDITTSGGIDKGHPFRQRMRAALDRARAG